jgi:predicted RNase H-like HicB family nuclease
MYRFLVVIEKAKKGFSAYAPDLPGCIATGNTVEDVEEKMHEAIRMHIEGLMEDDLPIPEPRSLAEYIAVGV